MAIEICLYKRMNQSSFMSYTNDIVMAAIASPVDTPPSPPVYHDVSVCMRLCAFFLVISLVSAVVIMHYIPVGSPSLVFVNATRV